MLIGLYSFGVVMIFEQLELFMSQDVSGFNSISRDVLVVRAISQN
jgi:hypothetical protein